MAHNQGSWSFHCEGQDGILPLAGAASGQTQAAIFPAVQKTAMHGRELQASPLTGSENQDPKFAETRESCSACMTFPLPTSVEINPTAPGHTEWKQAV